MEAGRSGVLLPNPLWETPSLPPLSFVQFNLRIKSSPGAFWAWSQLRQDRVFQCLEQKRKILSCFRSPLFLWVSFSPQRFITSQGPTLPANHVSSHLPFLGFKQTPHIQKQALRLPFGKEDKIMCLLSVKWPLMSSCLCSQEPKYSPNVTCSDRGPLTTPLQASALSPEPQGSNSCPALLI